MTRRLFLIAQIVLLALVGGAAAIPPRLLAVRYSALTRLLLAVCGGSEREFVLVIVSPIVPYWPL
jgi:hypothetical protein